jgi:hypothetical protein
MIDRLTKLTRPVSCDPPSNRFPPCPAARPRPLAPSVKTRGIVAAIHIRLEVIPTGTCSAIWRILWGRLVVRHEPKLNWHRKDAERLTSGDDFWPRVAGAATAAAAAAAAAAGCGGCGWLAKRHGAGAASGIAVLSTTTVGHDVWTAADVRAVQPVLYGNVSSTFRPTRNVPHRFVTVRKCCCG